MLFFSANWGYPDHTLYSASSCCSALFLFYLLLLLCLLLLLLKLFLLKIAVHFHLAMLLAVFAPLVVNNTLLFTAIYFLPLSSLMLLHAVASLHTVAPLRTSFFNSVGCCCFLLAFAP
jgi:hypothetical protein